MVLERVNGRFPRGGEDADGHDRDEHEGLDRAVLIRRSAALKEAALHPRALLLAKELRASRQRTTTYPAVFISGRNPDPGGKKEGSQCRATEAYTLGRVSCIMV